MHALLFRFHQPSAYFLCSSRVQRLQPQYQGIAVALLLPSSLPVAFPEPRPLVRGGFPSPNHATFTPVPAARSVVLSLPYGHVPGRESPDGLENVAAMNSGFFRRLSGRIEIAITYPNRLLSVIPLSPVPAFWCFLLEFVVFARRQVAGLRVQRFEQPMQRARRHHAHVRLIDIVVAGSSAALRHRLLATCTRGHLECARERGRCRHNRKLPPTGRLCRSVPLDSWSPALVVTLRV